MDKSPWTVLITGLFSVVVAILSGAIAYTSARANSRNDLKRIREQLNAQREAQEQDRVAELRQRYLTPLRYYASTLCKRLSELEAKLQSGDADRVRGWFKSMKDHVAADQRRADFGVWPYYEGIFAVTTIYYTCQYFQSAREVRYFQPFLRDSPRYSEELNQQLDRVRDSFVWNNGEQGIWDALQEVIGERFAIKDGKLSYEGMCDDMDSTDPRRRGHYLRPLDFYWTQLTPDRSAAIRATLDRLIGFLDSSSPEGVTSRGS